MTKNKSGEELVKLRDKIMEIGEELIKNMDLGYDLKKEKVKKVTKMMKECGIIIDKKNRELYKMWAKIEEADDGVSK